jgi:hypothetical protein
LPRYEDSLISQHLATSSNLISGRLLLLDSEVSAVNNTYIATSGLPNNQRFDCLSSKGTGPIPPQTIVGIDHYKVDTTPLYMPGVRGVEGNFYKISSFTVTVSNTERASFGIHFDANVPGSSGCVVLRTAVGWQASLERHESFINKRG